jgi:S-adenosylmethionine:diacylglycerol 3-amino-3-carboxypropyl transferase
MMAFGRVFAPLVGWRLARVREFLDLDDPAEQIEFWRRHLDTRRFRDAMDALLSRLVLRLVYAKPLLAGLPSHFGRVMRGRMERCFARWPNRENPYARALLLGEFLDAPPPLQARQVRLVHSDAADFLERESVGSFDGFTLSNILDGASDAYRLKLRAAVRRAGAPGAIVILRSFAEPRGASETNRAAEDRAMLWGIVEVALANAW